MNGFVFKSEEEAEDFGEKLDDTLQFEEIEVDDEEEIDFPEYTEVEIETPKTVRG